MSTADWLEDGTTSGLVSNDSTQSSSEESANRLVVFFGFVVGIGLFGSFMNGVVLSVLLSKKLRAKTSYLLIINQVVLDFLSSLFLLPCYIVKIHKVYMTGHFGKFICIVFFSDASVYSFQAGSITNLVLIAAERYFKIVHGVLHRTYFRRWMAFAGLIFIWIIAIFINIVFLWTTEVVDGGCYSYYYWPSGPSFVTYGGFVMVWEFVIPLVLFVYLYGRILFFVQQRMQAFHDNSTNQATTGNLQTNAHRSQMNVTITMIIVSSSFVLCWLPNQLFYLLTFIDDAYNIEAVYHGTVFLIFLNVCMNPLIYAAKHEEVKNRLKKWFCKIKVQPEVSTVAVPTSVSGTQHLNQPASLTGIQHA